MTTAPILLAYDGSPDAERALDWAADESRRTGVPLRVMTVEDVQDVPLVTSTRHGVPVVVESTVPEVLDHARTELAKAGVVTAATFEHRVGSVVSEILEAASASSVVVLGSRGHGLASEMLLGSVSQHVARHASSPVVVVRRPHELGARRIVVGMDGSPGSRSALELACRRAERTGETVVAVHGWHVHAPSTDVWSAVPRSLAEEDERRRLLSESVAGVRQDHPDIELELEAVGVAPATALVDASENASLVVVGARGRSFVGGLLLGSVSQSVLRHAQCPVAVVR
jgi:nucleotide-binding universal stress UspA family protein